MTVKELKDSLEGLDDNGQVYVKTADNEDYYYNIFMAGDKVTRVDLQNEITLYCE